jgi:hypothetical protein
MAGPALQECNDLPPLRFGQVGKGWHTPVNGSITQDPEQSPRCGSIYLGLSQRWNVTSTFPGRAVAGSALTGVQLGAGTSGLVVAFKRIPPFRRPHRSLLYQAPYGGGTDDSPTNKKTDDSYCVHWRPP